MGRNTDGNARTVRGYTLRYVRMPSRNDRQWTWPEARSQVPEGLRDIGRDARKVSGSGKMHDQGIAGIPLLRLIEPGDGAVIKRVRTKPVNGLGREGDKPT